MTKSILLLLTFFSITVGKHIVDDVNIHNWYLTPGLYGPHYTSPEYLIDEYILQSITTLGNTGVIVRVMEPSQTGDSTRIRSVFMYDFFPDGRMRMSIVKENSLSTQFDDFESSYYYYESDGSFIKEVQEQTINYNRPIKSTVRIMKYDERGNLVSEKVGSSVKEGFDHEKNSTYLTLPNMTEFKTIHQYSSDLIMSSREVRESGGKSETTLITTYSYENNLPSEVLHVITKTNITTRISIDYTNGLVSSRRVQYDGENKVWERYPVIEECLYQYHENSQLKRVVYRNSDETVDEKHFDDQGRIQKILTGTKTTSTYEYLEDRIISTDSIHGLPLNTVFTKDSLGRIIKILQYRVNENRIITESELLCTYY